MPIAIRALDLSDAPALHAICTHPEVARDLPEHDPSQPLALFRALLEAVTPAKGVLVGAEVEGVVVGVAGLELVAPPRRRHTGRVWAAVHPSAQRRGVGRALLAEMLLTADRWYHLDRVEIAIPTAAEHALRLASSMGFDPEVRCRQALWREGSLADMSHLAWLRPGTRVSSTEAQALPARPGERWEVTLRAARVEDAPAIAELQSAASVRWGTLQLPYTPSRFWRHRLETNDPAQHHLLVAEHAGRVVGLAGLHGLGLLRTAHVWPMGMAVRQEAQGRGVGSALLRGVLSLADLWLGARRVELEVYADNVRAISLYERHGFEREGTQRCDAWRDGAYVDSLVMARLR